MGHASKGILVLRPVHATDRKLSPVREPSVSHVATGPIVLRRDSNPDWMRPWRIASTGWATKACAGNPQGYARAVHCGFDHSCRILALMLAVDAHTATRGMTGITGAETPCSSRPFPHPVVRLTRNAVARVPGNLSRTGRIGFIGFAPTLPTESCSHHPLIG